MARPRLAPGVSKNGAATKASARHRARAAGSVLAGAATGAFAAYLLDTDRGRSRRARAADQLAAGARHLGRRLGRQARHGVSDVRGLGQKIVHSTARPGRTQETDDVTLVQRVQSTVFADAGMPKGRVNLNAEDGTIVLRGEVERPEQMAELERAVRAVPGVRGVRNLLHPSGTPAPGKAAAIEASKSPKK